MTRAAAHAPEFMPGTAAESFETRLIHPATLSIFKFPAKNGAKPPHNCDFRRFFRWHEKRCNQWTPAPSSLPSPELQ
jgi:hypothetical protein